MFSATQDEYLIDLVQKYPVIYDLSNPKYMDTNFKYEIWQKIAKELEKDVHSCKQRWGNIRDQYRKSLKKEETRSGQAASQVRAYKYKEQLRFLNATFEERDTLSNLGPPESGSINQNYNVEPSDDDEHNVSQPSIIPETPTTSKKRAIRKKSVPYSRKSVSRNDDASSASTKLMDYLIAKKSSDTDPHPVDAFLSGIAPILKSLNTVKLHKARSEIFSVVQKYELEMLLDGSNSEVNELPLIAIQGCSSSATLPPPPDTQPPFESSPNFISDHPSPSPSPTIIIPEPSDPPSIVATSSAGTQYNRTESEHDVIFEQISSHTVKSQSLNHNTDTVVKKHEAEWGHLTQPFRSPQGQVQPSGASQMQQMLSIVTPKRKSSVPPPINEQAQRSTTSQRKIIDLCTSNPFTMQRFIENYKM